jgi:hypothetical protein
MTLALSYRASDFYDKNNFWIVSVDVNILIIIKNRISLT